MRRALRQALPRNERGVALLLSLMALVVIAALAAGVFVAGRLEMVGGRSTVLGTQAMEAAETGLNDMLVNWSVAYNTHDVYGDSVFPTTSIAGAGSQYTQTLTRMQGGKYLLKVRGDRLNAGGTVIATRYLSRYLRLAIPYLDIQAAVTAQDGINVGGNIDVDGTDTVPPNWPGCPAGSDKAGGRSASTITAHGASSVTGTPAEIENDPSVVDSIFTVPFNALRDMATMTLAAGTYTGMAPSLSGSVCDRSNQNNWGEPYWAPTAGVVAECHEYYPIIYVPGNLSVSGGRGQGILLVQGEFQATGGFIFDGIVIALTSAKVNGNGNKITGALLTQGDAENLHGTPDIYYSSCAIYRSLQHSVRAEPMADRSWAQRVN